MTYEKALVYFIRRKTQFGLSDNIQRAEDLAIEALEKHISKKPINVEKHYYECPCCKRDLGISDDDIFVYDEPKPQYCSDCGQTLNWGDTE